MFKVGSKVRLVPIKELERAGMLLSIDARVMQLKRNWEVLIDYYTTCTAKTLTIVSIEYDADYEDELVIKLQSITDTSLFYCPVECLQPITITTRRHKNN